MHRTILLCSSTVLLFFVFSFIHGAVGESSSSTSTTTTTITTTTKRPFKKHYRPGAYRYDYGNDNYGGYGNNYGSNSRGGYGGYNDDNDDGYYQAGGYDGDRRDPGPNRDDRPPMSATLDVWIYSADDWEQKGDRNGGRGRDKKYNRGKKYGDDGGNRNKRSSRVRFPVQQIRNFRQFPFGRFPPLISILPWLPIFYDKLTYQTFIFSPTGGIYIIPPLINFYGQRFAVAQLIQWGYASLVSSGAPPPPSVDVAPLVQPVPAGGAVAGVVGGPPAGPTPTYDSKKLRFNGGVKTDFSDFKPRYPQSIQEGGDRDFQSNYRVDSDYGGTRKQDLYAQGGGYNY